MKANFLPRRPAAPGRFHSGCRRPAGRLAGGTFKEPSFRRQPALRGQAFLRKFQRPRRAATPGLPLLEVGLLAFGNRNARFQEFGRKASGLPSFGRTLPGWKFGFPLPGGKEALPLRAALGTEAASRGGLGRAKALPRKFSGAPPEGRKNFRAAPKSRPRLNGRDLAPRPSSPKSFQAEQGADNARARPPRGRTHLPKFRARRERPKSLQEFGLHGLELPERDPREREEHRDRHG